MDTTVRKRLLERLGLSDLRSVRENLSPARLVEESIRRGEAALSDSGALVAETGERTGRSPADRFIVENAATKDRVTWGAINKPFSSEGFGQILEKAAVYAGGLDELFVVDDRVVWMAEWTRLDISSRLDVWRDPEAARKAVEEDLLPYTSP